MTIKDIAISVATYLNKTDLVEYLSGKTEIPTTDTLTQIDVLTRLSNLVINELSTSYVPITAKEEVIVQNGKVKIEDLKHKALRILNVYDKEGNVISFKVDGEYVKVYNSVVFIEYTYLPDNLGLEEEIGFDQADVSLSVISFGVCAEYCLTEWRFDEAVMWRERYISGIKAVTIPKSKQIKGRSWL